MRYTELLTDYSYIHESNAVLTKHLYLFTGCVPGKGDEEAGTSDGEETID